MKLNLQAAIDGKLDEQLNLALCEWLGWRSDGVWGNFWTSPSGNEHHEESGFKLPSHINTPESLGLVHEVEKKLSSKQHSTYLNQLQENCMDEWWAERHYTITTACATARQRVIAILQTVKPEVFGNFLCESCEESDVEKALEREPYAPAHWICPSCHGTYPEWTYPK